MTERTALSPPTTSYQSFKAVLRVLQQHGVPAVVDHGALRKRFPSGSVEGLLAALRFFDLVDGAGAPTPSLDTLKGAVETEAWPGSLRVVLLRAYGAVLEEGLENATPAQLNERLNAAFALSSETCRRSATFLLAAANDAGLPISPYLMAPPRSRGRLVQARPGRANHEDRGEPAGDALAARLIEKLPPFDPAWPDALKEHWFKQFNELVQLVRPDDRPRQT
jgi:hypothetical protein